MISESDYGLRARISIEEKGIIVQQSLWKPIQEILAYKNSKLTCKEGDPKTTDFEHMRSYCYYDGNCLNLALESLIITLPKGQELEIVKSQYLLQQADPFKCEIMIQALPDQYLQEMNDIELIIGQPLFFNYYTLFSVQDAKVGFYKTSYTVSQREFTLGALFGILLFLAISIGGFIGCIFKYREFKNEVRPQVSTKREVSAKNQRRQAKEAGFNINRHNNFLKVRNEGEEGRRPVGPTSSAHTQATLIDS
mmetsp:Transcript_1112/g.2038  ORF Transcript_1112/g.2038 Transcript_1112/m.2038 type:complete len:251 (+) Transcript_1112:1003-1755(+)